ncbi:MAG: hypothetical protein P4L87_21310 [Formivibrio sp.]|nr:hypothetical protein [Formivibrio sp.]
MKTRTLIQAAMAMTALLGTAAAFAASSIDGTPVSGQVKGAHPVSITAQTRYLNARNGEVLRFNLPNGNDFSWKFDGTGNYVTLADIAPAGSNINPNLRVYVASQGGAEGGAGK